MKKILSAFFAAIMALLSACCGGTKDMANKDSAQNSGTITVNLRYTGKNGNARKFAEEMTKSGTVAKIRAEQGNIKYEYFISYDDPETLLLIDSWESQAAIDAHHATPMMQTIAQLREKYDLKMTAERYSPGPAAPAGDDKFIRK